MYVVVLGMRAQLRPAVVVFDLDGTLIVFKLNVRAAKQRIIQRLKELGLNTQGITADDSVQSIITKTLGNNSGVERMFFRSLRKGDTELLLLRTRIVMQLCVHWREAAYSAI